MYFSFKLIYFHLALPSYQYVMCTWRKWEGATVIYLMLIIKIPYGLQRIICRMIELSPHLVLK